MPKSVDVNYGTETVCYQVEGDTFVGEDKVMLLGDDNLVSQCPWADSGYTIAPFLEPRAYTEVQAGIRELTISLLEKEGMTVDQHFNLHSYHHYVSDNEDIHRAVVQQFQEGFSEDRFPIDLDIVTKRISDIINVPLKNSYRDSADAGHFCIRVVRPGKNDNNPLHRDVWLDRARHAINVYAPLAGSNHLSALPLIPESHHWREADVERTTAGATVNGVSYTVPAVVSSSYGLHIVRPNPQPNEVMVFSPYLIHGGGINLNSDVTRVSLELRFWRHN